MVPDENRLRRANSISFKNALSLLIHDEDYADRFTCAVENGVDLDPTYHSDTVSPEVSENRRWICDFFKDAVFDGTIQRLPTNDNGKISRQSCLAKASYILWVKSHWDVLHHKRNTPTHDSKGDSFFDLLKQMVFPPTINIQMSNDSIFRPARENPSPPIAETSICEFTEADLNDFPLWTVEEALGLIISQACIRVVGVLAGCKYVPSYVATVKIAMLADNPEMPINRGSAFALGLIYQERLTTKDEKDIHDEFKAIYKVFLLFDRSIQNDEIRIVNQESQNPFDWLLDKKSFVSWVSDNKTKIEKILKPVGLEIYRPEFFKNKTLCLSVQAKKRNHVDELITEALNGIFEDERTWSLTPKALRRHPLIKKAVGNNKMPGKSKFENLVYAVKKDKAIAIKTGRPLGTKSKRSTKNQTQKSSDAVDPSFRSNPTSIKRPLKITNK